jgi:Beta-lactamase
MNTDREKALRAAAVASLLVGALSCGAKAPAATSPQGAAAAAASSSAPMAAEPIVDLPRTKLGDLARSFIEVVNGGKLDVQRDFVKNRFGAKALEETSPEEWSGFLQRMWTQSGGIDVVEVFPPRGPNHISFGVRSRRGRHFANLLIVAPSADGERVDLLFCNPVPDRSAIHAGKLTPVPMPEEEAVRAINRRAEQLAATDRFTGSVLVARGNRVLVGAAFGQADKAFGVPNRLDTKFNLGSMNKMFTAIAIGQLVERGRLSFGDSLAKALPD